jgi:lipoprotein-anchoring transpeptidase ErfK/SrfK
LFSKGGRLSPTFRNQLHSKRHSSKVKAKPNTKSHTQKNIRRKISVGRWAAIGLVALVLGFASVFLFARSRANFLITSQASAKSQPEPQLVAAIFETDLAGSNVLTSNTSSIIEGIEGVEGVEGEGNTENIGSQESIIAEENTPVPTQVVAQETATPAPTEQQLAAKLVSDSDTAREAWTPTPLPPPTMEPTRLSEATSFSLPNVTADERWVDINLTLQTLTAYEGNSPAFQTIISSGRPPYYTVTGEFRVYYRLEEQTMDGRRLGFDYVTEGVPHVQYFYGDFAIHGAYWHNDFGTPVSHGCVNVTPIDAEWLYNWMSYGTLVSVHY